MAEETSDDKPKPPRTAYENLRNDLPGNTKKQKSENEQAKKKIEKIVDGEVVQRKPSLGRRIAATFTGDDSRTVGNYILFEVAIPAVKQLLSDAVSTGIERLLFGGSDRRPSSGARRGYTAYNRYSSVTGTNNRPNQYQANPRAVHNFDDIVLDNRGTAEEVIDALGDLISQFDFASVSDLYELVGITGTYADDKWGWTSMAGARVERVRDGYLLNLPRTQPIN